MRGLTYVAGYDPYHAIFRNIFLLLFVSKVEIEVEKLRILDFYTCFPHLAASFKPSRKIAGQIKSHNAMVNNYPDTDYSSKMDPATLFRRMRPAQLAGINSLAAYGLIEGESFRRDWVRRTSAPLPEPIVSKAESFRASNPALFTFLSSIESIPLNGEGGLKARSNLEEYRYDTI